MYQIDVATASSSQPARKAAGTPGYWNDGTPGSVARTVLEADWFNAVMNELLYVITEASITPSKTTDTQLYQAIEYFLSGGGSGSMAATESAYGPTRLATQAETITGTSRALAVDPANLAYALKQIATVQSVTPEPVPSAVSSGSTGTIGNSYWEQNPVTGQITQWFTVLLADTGENPESTGVVVTLPKALSNGISRVWGTNLSIVAGQLAGSGAAQYPNAQLNPEVLTSKTTIQLSIHGTSVTGTQVCFQVFVVGT